MSVQCTGVLVKADAVEGVVAVGVAVESVVAGEVVRVRTSGFLPSEAAVAGVEYWLGSDGEMARELPVGWKVLQRVGMGVAGGVLIEIKESALKC